MAYRPHTYVTVSGNLQEVSANDEIWQIGVRGFNPTSGADTPVDAGQLQNLADAIWTPMAAWFGGTTSYFPSSARMTQVKCANIGADGKYTALAATHNGTQAGGTTATKPIPSFCCIAYTFRTANPGKRARNGRVYPPNYANGVSAGSVIAAADVTQNLAAAAAFLAALNQTGAQFTFRPAVVSSLGPYAYINSVGVDAVIDVQRRRKDKISSSGRTSQAYTPAH